MKKVLLSLLLFSFSSTVFADDNTLNLIKNEDKVFYSQENSIWLKEPETNNEQILTKTLFEGAGSYSIYNKEDGSLAFALATDCELINNGKLIIVDNNILKYYKLEYNDGSIEQIELTDEETLVAGLTATADKIVYTTENGEMYLMNIKITE